MKHKKLRPQWKILLILILLVGVYFLYNNLNNKKVSYSKEESSPTANNINNINNKKKTNEEQPLEEKQPTKEEVIETPQVKRVNTGLYYKNSTDNITINNLYLTNYRTSFKLNEPISIFIDATINETVNGTIYITQNGEPYTNAINMLEYNETNLIDGSLSFIINFEEHDIGYYDIYVLNNDKEIAKYVFQILE